MARMNEQMARMNEAQNDGEDGLEGRGGGRGLCVDIVALQHVVCTGRPPDGAKA